MFPDAPSWNGLRTAAIGCFSFKDAASGAATLSSIGKALRDESYEAVVGPMDGSTWGAYRLPIWSDGSPDFLMEPNAAKVDFEAYERAGFEVVELHVSASAAPGSRGFAKAVPSLRIESWNGQRSQDLLSSAHSLVMEGFRNTPFFVPVPEALFIQRYAPLLAKADPRFILRAIDEDGAVRGLTLAFPDPIRLGAVVLKTYVGAIPGAGRVMADRIHELAGELGYREVVHALMRSGIASEAQSRKFDSVAFRHYALMGLRL